MQLKWTTGLKAAFKSIGAKQRDQYSWVAKADDFYVFTAEIDHVNAKNNIYNHNEGTFEKYVRPHSIESGDAPRSISHSIELFDAVNETFSLGRKCKLLLVKGTKSGKTEGAIRAAVDGDSWAVESLEGSAEEGYKFKLARTE